MLRADVVDAVDAGQFSIYAIDSVDQGLEILTGLHAGTVDAQGIYPEGSFYRRVADQLATFAEKTARDDKPGTQQPS